MKNKPTFFILLFSFLLSFSACDTLNTNKAKALTLTTDQQKIASSADQFGFDLFRQTSKAEVGTSNIFISPLSVSMAFGLALNGANGTTRTEIEAALKLSGLSPQQINEAYQLLLTELPKLDPKVQMNIANSIWYRSGFTVKPAFLTTNQTFFNAEVKSLDFTSASAPNTINDWVKDKTQQKITKIIDSIPDNMVMYLINALYFKGSWQQKFDTNNTQDESFTLSNGSKKTVKMMNQTYEYNYMSNDLLQAAELPYGNDIYSMTVLLPKEGKTVDQVIAQLDGTNWQAWQKSMVKQKIEMGLPRFKTEYEVSLNGILQNMGIKTAFTEQADFKGIADANLLITEVKHKTFVEVNEEGTEAAAVTSIGVGVTSLPSYPIMKVNRPFVFVIREKATGTLLFMGKIVNPAA